MPREKSRGRSSRLHLRGFEEVRRSHRIRGGGTHARESAYHADDVDEENDMAGRDEQIAHRAGTQKWQCAPRNLDERDAWVLQLETLHNASDGERHNNEQNAQRGDPQMRADQFCRWKFDAGELRHDVVDRSEHYQRKEPVEIGVHSGRREPGEIRDLANWWKRGRNVHQPGDDETEDAQPDKLQRNIRFYLASLPF